jgi:uncharacterized membrane protein HdeD (DUF308 family)
LSWSGAAARLAFMENTTHQSSRIWYILGGILSIFVGIYAMNRPGLATVAVTQVVGIIALASGLVLLLAAIFGKARQHRLFDFFSAIVRIVVGLLLVANVLKGVLILTLVLGSVFIIEGIYGLVLGMKLRGKNPAWGWVVLNGVAALVLGVMLIAQFPGSAIWAIGLLFGINCIFTGFTLIAYGSALPKAQEA